MSSVRWLQSHLVSRGAQWIDVRVRSKLSILAATAAAAGACGITYVYQLRRTVKVVVGRGRRQRAFCVASKNRKAELHPLLTQRSVCLFTNVGGGRCQSGVRQQWTASTLL
jgi:hypothetical protein